MCDYSSSNNDYKIRGIMVTGIEFLLISEHEKLKCGCDVESAKENIDKAIELHGLHLKDTSTVTDESQIELQDYIKRAKCNIAKCSNKE